MIIIDFAPGLHGHFLEYVVNQYIFQIKTPMENIFQSTGAAHLINFNAEYQFQKAVSCGHFSSFSNPYPAETTSVIFIKHDPALDFVLLTNIFNRCSPDVVRDEDANADEIKKLHIGYMFAGDHSLCDLRTNWYTKLQQRHFAETELRLPGSLLTFDFKLESFFSLSEFIIELQRLAEFVSMTLVFDQTMVALWNKFISINQGHNKYCQANHLINCILSNQPHPIDQSDWQTQSYINHRLTQMFRMYDGIMFTAENNYPSDTQQIHQLVLNHIAEFDQKF